MLNVKTLNRL